MKKSVKGFILGVLVGVTIVGGAAAAANTSTLYNVITEGISIIIDGNKLVPKDVNGNIVEPMIYNGTTYLPVRAIANAFGANVNWDDITQSVIISTGDNSAQTNTNVGSDTIFLDENDKVSVLLAFGDFSDDTTDWNTNAREAALAVKKYGIEQGYSDMYDIYDVTVYAGYYEIAAGHSYYGDDYQNNSDIFYVSWDDYNRVSMDFSEIME